MKAAVLYLSYDGMLEPLGQSQVLAYLERLAGDYGLTSSALRNWLIDVLRKNERRSWHASVW